MTRRTQFVTVNQSFANLWPVVSLQAAEFAEKTVGSGAVLVGRVRKRVSIPKMGKRPESQVVRTGIRLLRY